MHSYTWEELEAIRDPVYRRTPGLRVRTCEDALDFVNQRGLVFAFRAKHSELPCLWHATCGERNPVMPVHTHHDPYISLVWEAKDRLAANKQIYYGKALRKIPTMISLELFPYFYVVNGHGSADAYLTLFTKGELSSPAKRIMDILTDTSPLSTMDLKIAAGFSSPSQRYTFDKAMAELQEHLFIVKIAEEYDPFTFIWGVLDRWLFQEVKQARKISSDEGRYHVLKRYFSSVVASSPLQIERLFKWNRSDIEMTINALLSDEIISGAIPVIKKPGPWYIHTSYING